MHSSTERIRSCSVLCHHACFRRVCATCTQTRGVSERPLLACTPDPHAPPTREPAHPPCPPACPPGAHLYARARARVARPFARMHARVCGHEWYENGLTALAGPRRVGSPHGPLASTPDFPMSAVQADHHRRRRRRPCLPSPCAFLAYLARHAWASGVRAADGCALQVSGAASTAKLATAPRAGPLDIW